MRTMLSASPERRQPAGPPIRSKKRRRSYGPSVEYTHSENRTTDSTAPPAGSESDTVRRLSPARHTPKKSGLPNGMHLPRRVRTKRVRKEPARRSVARFFPDSFRIRLSPLRHPRRSGGFIGGPSACGAAGRPHQMERIFSVLSNSRLTGFWFLIALLNGM